MKRTVFFLLTLYAAGTLLAGDAIWLTSFPEAAAQATRESKLILLDFTGSDWCGWCKRLDSDTFSKPEFIDYAGQNVVLVQVDFPHGKSQPGDLKEANHALAEKYNVTGFPTVLVTKPDGTVLWEQRGYRPGGPQNLVNAVNKSRHDAGLPVFDTPKSAAAVAAAAPRPLLPTVPAPAVSVPKKANNQPKLTAILYSGANSTIVLDGTTCQVGETVHGMRVVKIDRDEVTVEIQGRTKVLTLD